MVARFASYFGRAHAVFFVGKYFVVLLSTTKTTKLLLPEKYPLYGNYVMDCIYCTFLGFTAGGMEWIAS